MIRLCSSWFLTFFPSKIAIFPSKTKLGTPQKPYISICMHTICSHFLSRFSDPLIFFSLRIQKIYRNPILLPPFESIRFFLPFMCVFLSFSLSLSHLYLLAPPPFSPTGRCRFLSRCAKSFVRTFKLLPQTPLWNRFIGHEAQAFCDIFPL